MAYTAKTWADGESGGTPITAAELNRVEAGVSSAHDEVDVLRTEGATRDGQLDSLEAADTAHGSDLAALTARVEALEAAASGGV